MIPSPHISVLLNEVVHAISPRDGGVYVDGTFGAGGYSRALLEAADCTVWGIDRDPLAHEIGADLVTQYRGRLAMLHGRFGDMVRLLDSVGVTQVDGVALDIGLSSMQIDDPERGFSFSNDGPLDMRMGQTGQSAADVVNEMAEQELADIIYKYGEERASRAVAKAIVAVRAETPITRTGQLAEIIRGVVYRSKNGIDPATRTFQALRIYVNGELNELEAGLSAAEVLLGPKGRLAVVSFHSLEDRIVKNFLQSRAGDGPRPSRHLPETGTATAPPTFKLIKRGTIKPSKDESQLNPRARSARLRVAERTSAPIRDAA